MEVCEGTSVVVTRLNHLQDLCALSTVCISTGAEGWSCPSEKVLQAVELSTSRLSSPHEIPFMAGLESSNCGKGSKGLWRSCSSWAQEWQEGQQSQVSALQGGLLHGDTRIYWLYYKMANNHAVPQDLQVLLVWDSVQWMQWPLLGKKCKLVPNM